jgi:hypothetical protein
LKTFKEGIDPEELMVKTDKGKRCKVFSRHVTKGQSVRCNERQVEKIYRTEYEFQSHMSFKVFATELFNPRYRSDCSLIGNLDLKLPNPEEKLGRGVIVSMTFSGTEIIVKAMDVNTGKETSAYTNFLG